MVNTHDSLRDTLSTGDSSLSLKFRGVQGISFLKLPAAGTDICASLWQIAAIYAVPW